MTGANLQTVEERAELVASLSGNEAAVYAFLNKNHWTPSKNIAKALAAQPEGVDRVLSMLRSKGMVQVMKQSGVDLWRPAPCKRPPAPPQQDSAGEDGAA